MKRIEFILRIGRFTGMGLLSSFVSRCSKKNDPAVSIIADCVKVPEETAGPYPFDLSTNTAMVRTNIAEGKSGTPLNLTLTVVDASNNCSAIENARVDIWHCDKDGYYSEYSESGYLGTENYVGETFLRGIQLTDSVGQVAFTTIHPGWYTGRITHIHVEVYINSVLKATTQIAFPDEINTAVYKTSLYSGHGENTSVADNAADMVFGDSASDLAHELCAITANAATGGYNATFKVGVNV